MRGVSYGLGCCGKGPREAGPLPLHPQVLVISSTFLGCNQGNRLDNQGQYPPWGSWLFCALSICDPVKCHIPSSLKTFCPYYFSIEPKLFCLAFKTVHDLIPSLLSPRLTHWASWHSPNTPAASYLLTHCSLSPECLLLSSWGILSLPPI